MFLVYLKMRLEKLSWEFRVCQTIYCCAERAVSSGRVYTPKDKYFKILFGSVYRLKDSNPKNDMDKSFPGLSRSQINWNISNILIFEGVMARSI